MLTSAFPLGRSTDLVGVPNAPMAPTAPGTCAHLPRELDRVGKPAQTLNANLARNDALDYSIADLVAIAYGRRIGGQTIEGTAEEQEPRSISAE